MKKTITIRILLIATILCITGCSAFISQKKSKPDTIDSGVDSSKSRFRSLIETAYPEFKDFENQKSFAGQKVKFVKDESDICYAYMVLGSGVPIAKATCFRVDQAGRVYKVAEFPDPSDSYVGYSDIDPCTCKGIK
jgi:hypothetical protein